MKPRKKIEVRKKVRETIRDRLPDRMPGLWEPCYACRGNGEHQLRIPGPKGGTYVTVRCITCGGKGKTRP